jgi:hypothetical protein
MRGGGGREGGWGGRQGGGLGGDTVYYAMFCLHGPTLGTGVGGLNLTVLCTSKRTYIPILLQLM